MYHSQLKGLIVVKGYVNTNVAIWIVL